MLYNLDNTVLFKLDFPMSKMLYRINSHKSIFTLFLSFSNGLTTDSGNTMTKHLPDSFIVVCVEMHRTPLPTEQKVPARQNISSKRLHRLIKFRYNICTYFVIKCHFVLPKSRRQVCVVIKKQHIAVIENQTYWSALWEFPSKNSLFTKWNGLRFAIMTPSCLRTLFLLTPRL